MKSSVKRNLILLFSTIIIFFFVGEIAVRTLDALNGYNFFSNELRDKLIIKKDPIVAFRIFGPDYYAEKDGIKYISSSHDELYPLIKPENTFRIVCFGGSTTRNQWTYQRYKMHYPIVLQELLRKSIPNKNIEVINVGFDAYSTPHFLITLLLDVISWSPDLVIISENHNDQENAYWGKQQLDYSNMYGVPSLTVPAYKENFTTINALFRWSSFYWFVDEKINLLSKQLGEKPVAKRVLLGNEPPKLGQYIFRRNLFSFYYIAHSWKIPVLFATQPLNSLIKDADYIPHKENERDYKYPLISEKMQYHKFFNNIIREVSDSTNSYFVDNDSLLGGKPEYFIDALHYSKSGVEKLAQNYADYIISKKIIK